MINEERLVDNFLALGRIDGIHGNELSVAQELMNRFEALGLKVSMDGAGATFGGNAGNIRAFLDGTVATQPVLLCAHMDTIQSTKNIKHVRSNGTIATDGTTILGGDDRSGLAVILEILETLRDQKIPHGPIEILCTVCEEAGMHGAKFIRRSDFSAPFGFVFDCQASPGNYIVEAPAAVSFKATVRGKSAHAAVSPEKGIHAIRIASRAIAALKLGRWDHTGMLNIGTIHGGTSINVIPDVVEITGETRNVNEENLHFQIDHIKLAFNTAAEEAGGSVEIIFTEKYGGYQFTDEHLMIHIAAEAIRESGLDPIPLKYPGGSDANVLNKNGIPMLNLGVGFKNAHSVHEYIEVKDLVMTAQIGLNIIRKITRL